VISFDSAGSPVCGHWWAPKLMLVGEDVTFCLISLATSMRPEPCSNGVSFAVGVVLPVSRALSSAPFSEGCCWCRRAAAPATCGVAIEVPSSEV
jgi:hypothetical protein